LYLKRYEVRTRICTTAQDIELIERFFSRRNAENFCLLLNSTKNVFGPVGYTYYIHDRKDGSAST
jgi:hypothetical protein